MKLGDLVTTKYQLKYSKRPEAGVVTSLIADHFVLGRETDECVTVHWLDGEVTDEWVEKLVVLSHGKN